jgi:hypothetical protein
VVYGPLSKMRTISYFHPSRVRCAKGGGSRGRVPSAFARGA